MVFVGWYDVILLYVVGFVIQVVGEGDVFVEVFVFLYLLVVGDFDCYFGIVGVVYFDQVGCGWLCYYDQDDYWDYCLDDFGFGVVVEGGGDCVFGFVEFEDGVGYCFEYDDVDYCVDD